MERRGHSAIWMQRILLLASLSVVFTFLFMWYSSLDPYEYHTLSTARHRTPVKWAKELKCFNEVGNIGPVLDFDEPVIGDAVFFLLTSCPDQKDISLNARQACAVESAAFFHKDKGTYAVLIFHFHTRCFMRSCTLARVYLCFTNHNYNTINSSDRNISRVEFLFGRYATHGALCKLNHGKQLHAV